MPELSFANFQDFAQEAKQHGFDTCLVRDWPANTVVGTHTHDFSVWAYVAEGEMWLTVADQTQHLVPGNFFSLDAAVPHAERYGSQGAAFWVGRKKPS